MERPCLGLYLFTCIVWNRTALNMSATILQNFTRIHRDERIIIVLLLLTIAKRRKFINLPRSSSWLSSCQTNKLIIYQYEKGFQTTQKNLIKIDRDFGGHTLTCACLWRGTETTKVQAITKKTKRFMVLEKRMRNE